MTQDRQLHWVGCINVRDLGGLSTGDGRQTRWGVVVRSDHPAKLTALGWAALYAHGIRTIITLATVGKAEAMPDTAPRPSDLTTRLAEIEDLGDKEFLTEWAATGLWCTPLYYRYALQRWPERHAAAIGEIALARPGGVLVHCIGGRDRTGIIALLLLAFAGVSADDIAADYDLSVDAERDEILAQAHTTSRAVILDTLAGLDAEAYLRSGGLSQAELTALRARLIENGL